MAISSKDPRYQSALGSFLKNYSPKEKADATKTFEKNVKSGADGFTFKYQAPKKAAQGIGAKVGAVAGKGAVKAVPKKVLPKKVVKPATSAFEKARKSHFGL